MKYKRTTTTKIAKIYRLKHWVYDKNSVPLCQIGSAVLMCLLDTNKQTDKQGMYSGRRLDQ